MAEQTLAAVDVADVVLFVFDARAIVKGGSPYEVVDMARWLRKHRGSMGRAGPSSRVVMCANKLEGDAWANMGGDDDVLDQMGNLGFGEPLLISAEHGDGMADIASVLHQEEERIREEEGWEEHEDGGEEDETISLAILGRQNVGKSTLLNGMVKQNRVITGSYAGLTRDAISVDYGGGESRR